MTAAAAGPRRAVRVPLDPSFAPSRDLPAGLRDTTVARISCGGARPYCCSRLLARGSNVPTQKDEPGRRTMRLPDQGEVSGMVRFAVAGLAVLMAAGLAAAEEDNGPVLVDLFAGTCARRPALPS